MEFFIEKFLLIYREMENAFGVEENIKRLMLRSKKKKMYFSISNGFEPGPLNSTISTVPLRQGLRPIDRQEKIRF